MTTVITRKPLICRLILNHRWLACSTEDGGRYQCCRRSGKDGTGIVGDPHEM